MYIYIYLHMHIFTYIHTTYLGCKTPASTRVRNFFSTTCGEHTKEMVKHTHKWPASQTVTYAHGVDAHGVGAHSAQPHRLGKPPQRANPSQRLSQSITVPDCYPWQQEHHRKRPHEGSHPSHNNDRRWRDDSAYHLPHSAVNIRKKGREVGVNVQKEQLLRVTG